MRESLLSNDQLTKEKILHVFSRVIKNIFIHITYFKGHLEATIFSHIKYIEREYLLIHYG